MTDHAKHFGLIVGRSYVHAEYSKWGQGVVFIDKAGHLKIDFSGAGIKRVLSESSAAKLKLLPAGFKYFNKPARMSDGQLVVVMSGEISLGGDEVYKVFREIEPRLLQVRDGLVPVTVKDMRVLALMNDFFKFTKNLPLNANGIRMSPRRARRTSHCYNCKETGLDSSTDFECASCNWIICPVCGACGCGRGHTPFNFS